MHPRRWPEMRSGVSCFHLPSGTSIQMAIRAGNDAASKHVGSTYGYKVERLILDREKIKIGKVTLEFLLTPGHTPDGMCIMVDNKAIITGDTLFIGDCGRIDLPGGSLKEMYNSLDKLTKILSDDIIVYPGHDYGNKPFDTMGNLRQSLISLVNNIKESL